MKVQSPREFLGRHITLIHRPIVENVALLCEYDGATHTEQNRSSIGSVNYCDSTLQLAPTTEWGEGYEDI